jgi:hypothetical protein
MSELINLVTSSIGVDKTAVLRENLFLEEFFNIFKGLFNILCKIGHLNSESYFSSGLCRIKFHVKVTKKIEPIAIGDRIRPEWLKNSLFKKFSLPYYLIRTYGIYYCIQRFFEIFWLAMLYREKKCLRVQLRCWPNLYTIDLEENKKCTSSYYKNKTALPFCYYNIIDSCQKAII